MKRYTLSFAASIDHKPEYPERTAKRSGTGLNLDVFYQVWPARVAMARTIRMQQKSASHPTHWRAVVPLKDNEGY